MADKPNRKRGAAKRLTSTCTNNDKCKSNDMHVTCCPVYKRIVADYDKHPERYETGPIYVMG